MYKRRNGWGLLLACWGLLTMLTACVEDLTLSPKEGTRKVVVSCVLHNTKVQKLQLTYSNPVNEPSFPEEVEVATPTLYEEDKAVGTFSKIGYGEWELNYTPQRGKAYRLVVEVPGHPTITATTTMPIPVGIYRGDPRNQNITKPFTQSSHSAPLWICALTSSLKEAQYVLKKPKVEDDAQARLISIIATTHKDADRFTQDEIVDRSNTFNDGSTPYENYIRLAPNPAITRDNSYDFTIAYGEAWASFIVMRSASTEYDRYLKSILEKLKFYEDPDDPARWFDETVIFSNIENGLGIFAAYWQQDFYYNNIYPSTPLPHDE